MHYKARVYKLGRAYIYKANQVISLGLSLMISLTWQMLNKFELSNSMVALTFGILGLVIFGLLEANVTKAKMLRHRNAYPIRKKYILPFYIVFGLWMSVFVFFYFQYK